MLGHFKGFGRVLKSLPERGEFLHLQKGFLRLSGGVPPSLRVLGEPKCRHRASAIAAMSRTRARWRAPGHRNSTPNLGRAHLRLGYLHCGGKMKGLT